MDRQAKKILGKLGVDLAICQLLDDDQREQIASYLELVHYPEGETVFRQGEPGDYVGVVVGGKLEVKKQTEFEGRQIIIAILQRGAFVGELALVDEQPRSATVTALEDTEMVLLYRDALAELLEQNPEAGIAFLKAVNRILSIRLRKAVDRIAEIF
ncbi:MAG: cyclic nucleotide-binding domain-containing protein [Nitrospirota bacterium]|jgi:CRP-like cAMP-binding protein